MDEEDDTGCGRHSCFDNSHGHNNLDIVAADTENSQASDWPGPADRSGFESDAEGICFVTSLARMAFVFSTDNCIFDLI
jgi:hypothetical protein